MHSEGEIRKAIKPLVELYGEINMSDVKKKISDVLDFDADDIKKSKTRNGEMRIIQRIGNISSHQIELVKVYPEGFALDKRKHPAVFKSITGFTKNIRIKTKQEIVKIRKINRNHSLNNKKYVKLDWNMLNERKTTLGVNGETFVFQTEIERVKKIDPQAVDRVIHLSATQGDGFGYDILSVNNLGETIFIEVKTTKGNINSPFYMSVNEKNFFKANINNNAYIYRVYNFKEENRHGDICIISAKELFKKYRFDPVTFLVYKKK